MGVHPEHRRVHQGRDHQAGARLPQGRDAASRRRHRHLGRRRRRRRGSRPRPARSRARSSAWRSCSPSSTALYWLLKSAAKSRSGAERRPDRGGRDDDARAEPRGAPGPVGDELILVGATEHSVTPISVYSAEEAAGRWTLELADRRAASEHARGRPPAAHGMLEALRRRTARVNALPLLADHANTINWSAAARRSRRRSRSSLLLTLLAVLPGALLMLTGFTRILIVLGFVRNALGHADDAAEPGAGRDVDLPLAVRDGADAEADQRRSPIQPYTHARDLAAAGDRPRPGAAAHVHVQADARLRPGALRDDGRTCRARRRAPTSRPTS